MCMAYFCLCWLLFCITVKVHKKALTLPEDARHHTYLATRFGNNFEEHTKKRICSLFFSPSPSMSFYIFLDSNELIENDIQNTQINVNLNILNKHELLKRKYKIYGLI